MKLISRVGISKNVYAFTTDKVNGIQYDLSNSVFIEIFDKN